MIGPKSPFFMGDHCGMVTMPRPLGAGFPGPSRFGEAPGTPNEATWPPGSDGSCDPWDGVQLIVLMRRKSKFQLSLSSVSIG